MERTESALGRALNRLRSDQRGLELLEYAVLAAVLALALATAYILLGSQITSALARVSSSLGISSEAQSSPSTPGGRVGAGRGVGGTDRIGADRTGSVGGGAAVEPRTGAGRSEPPEERETRDEPVEPRPEREESDRDGEAEDEDREDGEGDGESRAAP